MSNFIEVEEHLGNDITTNMDYRYTQFEEFGSKELCENEISGQVSAPHWLDKDKIRRAKVLAQKHFFGILFAHLSGLVLLVHVKPILIPLLSTGNSRSVTHLFGRYFRTLMHIKIWYEGDVWDISDPAHKSIMQVRKMHTSVSKKLNHGKTNGTNQVSLSQFDMIVTQFAFIGLIALFPRQMGFSQSPEDIDAILHYWRGIGYLLGIEDKYNLCNGNIDQTKSLCQSILQEKIKKSITDSPPEEAVEMSRGIVNAIRLFVRLLTYEGLIKYLFEIIQIQKQIRLTLFASICYHSMKFTFNYLLHISVFAFILNYLLRFSIYLTNTNWRKNSIEKTLTNKYKLVFGQTLGSLQFQTVQSNQVITP